MARRTITPFHRRRGFMIFAVILLAAAGLVAATPASAATIFVDVRVAISQVDALDSFEEPGDADFYAIVTIDGLERSTDQCEFEDDDHIQPGWEFKKEDVDVSKGSVQIVIEIWDDDDPCGEPFTLRGSDDQAGLDPAGNGRRDLDLTVSLAPCGVTGDVTAACKTDITAEGNTDDDNAKIHFEVSVDKQTAAADMNIRCWHTPAWPQPGQAVTIRVEYLDGNLQPDVKMADSIEVFLGGDQTTPAGSATGVDEFTFITPALTAPSFSYACQLEDDGTSIWTTWRTVQVGPTQIAAGPVPIMFTGPLGGRIDVVFVPDADNYTGPADPTFLGDVSTLIQQAYFAQGDANPSNAAILLTNQDTFNFWLAGGVGDADPGGNTCPTMTGPPGWPFLYSFADVGAIMHTDFQRDCAISSQHLFTIGPRAAGLPISFNVLRHEQGHQPFGLADEYCSLRPGSFSSVCDGGYFEADPLPNVYRIGDACENDAPNLGRTGSACQSWLFWETSEPVSVDLMVDNTTPQAADRRRMNWMLNTVCASGRC